jgi:hypothetical protein
MGGNMDIKRLSIGSVAGLVVMYGAGMLLWDMLFADFFAANVGSAEGVGRDAPIVWAVALGTLMYACLITMTIDARSGTTSLMDGMKVGATIGVLLWGTADFVMYGYMNLNNLTATIADIVLEAVRGGIGGAGIAFALSKLGD